MNPHPKILGDHQPVAFSAPAKAYSPLSLRSASIQRIQRHQEQLLRKAPQAPQPQEGDPSKQDTLFKGDKATASDFTLKPRDSSTQSQRDSRKDSAPSHHRALLPRSPSIPIVTKGRAASASAGYSKRTSSEELRVQEEEELADFRDYVFFTRLVEGISKRKELHQNAPSRKHATLQHQNDLCLARIIGTRNGSLDSYTRNSVFPHPQRNGSWQENHLEESLSSSLAAASSSPEEIFVLDW
mmetsp:Transcript_28433/g.78091  ORF Transcript_28433/g.78091 Transcript_28433/m.78091 type:complete len:241 (-) Transcript_28433:314-1036(-)